MMILRQFVRVMNIHVLLGIWKQVVVVVEVEVLVLLGGVFSGKSW